MVAICGGRPLPIEQDRATTSGVKRTAASFYLCVYIILKINSVHQKLKQSRIKIQIPSSREITRQYDRMLAIQVPGIREVT